MGRLSWHDSSLSDDGAKKLRVDMHTHSECSPDSRTPLASRAAAIKAMAMLKELGCRNAELGKDARETVA